VDKWEERMLVYFLLAERYGWTPVDVDSMPFMVVRGIIEMLDEQARVERVRAQTGVRGGMG